MYSLPLANLPPLSLPLNGAVCALLFALAALIGTPAVTILILRRTGALRANFRGELIPTMFGLSITASSIMLLLLTFGHSPRTRTPVLIWIVLLLSFCVLGFVDDRWGNKEIKGLKGHIGAALKHRQITSGLVKAVGGVIAGLIIGYWLYPNDMLKLVAACMVIALSANGMNLLDLRPGRACAVFLICSTVLLAAALFAPTPNVDVLLLTFVVLPAVPAWLLDSRAKVMLGDTGSNVLGAAIGLAVADTQSIIFEVVTIAILIAAHIIAERRSITQIIANNKMLSSLDRLTGLRE